MFKKIIIFALLCVTIQAEVKLTFTKEYELIMNEPNFVKIDEEVIAVEYDKEFIKTSSSDALAKKCQFKLDQEQHAVDVKVKAEVLGNGKIVVTGSRYLSDTKNYRIFIVHVIDPFACTKSSFTKKIEVPGNEELFKYGNLVPYQDTYDIFYPNSDKLKCYPCRYNDKAEEIVAPFTVTRETLNINEKCKISFIKTIKEFNPSEGYFFACSYNNFTAGMKIMNSKFELIKEEYFKHPIYDVSIAKGSETHFGICYENPSNEKDHITRLGFCDILDSNLKLKHTVTLNSNEKTILTDVNILVLKDGSAWITEAQSKNGEEKENFFTRIFVRHIQTDGKSSESAEIKKIFDNNLKLYSYIFEKEYCIVIRDTESFTYKDVPKMHVRGKCFDVTAL